MTSKTKINIAVIILLVVAIIFSIGYHMYNKGPRTVKDSDGIPVRSAILYQGYSEDSIAAQKKYTDKILVVSGNIKDMSVNQQQQKIILLNTGSDGAYINCTMEDDVKTVKAGDSVHIKGICSGMGAADNDLGLLGDVYMTRCYLVK